MYRLCALQELQSASRRASGGEQKRHIPAGNGDAKPTDIKKQDGSGVGVSAKIFARADSAYVALPARTVLSACVTLPADLQYAMRLHT